MHSTGVDHTLAAVRVLVVEDDPISRDVALLMLDGLGYQADTAGDGLEALAAVHAQPYDVILMDLQLPEMDGMEATRRIRSELPASRQPSVVAMSASVSTDLQVQCLQTGMDDYLTKPVHVRDLAVALETWSSHADHAAQLSQPFQIVPDVPDDRSSTPPPVASVAPVLPIARVAAPLVFDPAPLDELVADLGPESGPIRRELIETFLDDGGDRVVAVGLAAHNDDGGALAFCAHAMKSASASLGLMALCEAAGRIESAFRDAPEEMDVAFEAVGLIAHHNRATAALRVVLETNAGKNF